MSGLDASGSGAPSICVVVSLFNPPAEIVGRCGQWQREIGPVVAVDDGSPDPAVRDVLDALAAQGVMVLVNHRNAGIARALNVGIRRALRDFSPVWILTMDQDSQLRPGYLDAARQLMAEDADMQHVGMLCAQWIGDVHLTTERSYDGQLLVTYPIQSGMFMRAEMIRQIGLFAEPLVIDSVDSEYVARARDNNWLPVAIPDGRLDHELGDLQPLIVCGHRVVLGGKPRHLGYHAPFRTYYATRNQFVMAHRFARTQPRKIVRKFRTQAVMQAAMVAFADDRWRQLRAIGAGMGDAFLGRYGLIRGSLAKDLGMRPPSPLPSPAACPRVGRGHPRTAQILLSTWNGQEFLAELLDSLLSQVTDAELRVLVRDDGSTDGTLTILHDYASRDSRISVITGENVGVNESFHALLDAADADADIYFFCDQDDVWCPDKVQIAVDSLQDRMGKAMPALYGSRSMITDAQLTPKSPTADLDSPSFANALTMNFAPGHTMAMNGALLECVRGHWDSERILVFDHWCYLVASALGEVVFDHGWHTLYRNHGDNAIGYVSGVVAVMRSLVMAFVQQDFSPYAHQAAAFADAFPGQLDARRQDRLNGFTGQGNVVARIRYVRRFGITHGTVVTSAIAVMLFIAGRYKS